MKRGKTITSWTLTIWWDNKKEENVDTSDMPDDLSQGIDDYLHKKLEEKK
jgi:hypothetical protein